MPAAGSVYARERNYDLGTADRHNVSLLSPYIRHRLLTEDEVVRAVLARHSAADAEKFIQEVFWRTYWKGWLEMRPAVWNDWQADVTRFAGTVPALAEAEAGQTGIACFDHWVGELTQIGYLHNHARMWFASLWIFTLGLPWQLGAAFFLRHLLDGDPASNTLSWRWVAGLQTPGKTYQATAANIETFTKGRFSLPALHEGLTRYSPPPPVANPAPAALPSLAPLPAGPALLLLTHEDLHPESLPLAGVDIAAVAALPLSPGDTAPQVSAFRDAALEDALTRACASFNIAGQRVAIEALAEHCRALGLNRIVTAYAPVGPVASALAQAETLWAAQGVTLSRTRRSWDSGAWPFATKGFFAFREHIPSLLPR